ncbi:MAG: ATP cone domain-containing protein, partial [Nitrosomonadales bacterium]|nr:ATP cone domain-containing protein [Nitrosomonadales bacterium]
MDDVAVSNSNTSHTTLPSLQVIRRNGTVVAFNPEKISIAMTKAFLAVEGNQTATSSRLRELVTTHTQVVVNALVRRLPAGGAVHIEDIQDQVELALMRSGEHDVARAYVLYREKRTAERASQSSGTMPTLHVNMGGIVKPLDTSLLHAMVTEACAGLGNEVNSRTVVDQAVRDLYDGISFDEVRKALILSARSLIEREPAYNYVTARLLLDLVRVEVLNENVSHAEMHTRYADY